MSLYKAGIVRINKYTYISSLSFSRVLGSLFADMNLLRDDPLYAASGSYTPIWKSLMQTDRRCEIRNVFNKRIVCIYTFQTQFVVKK